VKESTSELETARWKARVAFFLDGEGM
jgi:hypothetical protein